MVKEYNFVNAFRALAAFWVLSAHCMIWGGWYGIPLPTAKIAVDLFMLISGYLMTSNSFARQTSEPFTKLRNQARFWLRRFFRLAPAYYASLLVAVVADKYFLMGYQELQKLNPEQWATGGIYDPMRIVYSFENILLHLTFLFGLGSTWSFSTFLPDWSLSLEMQFYFVFPVLLLFLQKWVLALSAFFIGVTTFTFGFFIQKWAGYYEPSLLIFKLNYFIAGILAFYIINSEMEVKKVAGLVVCAFLLVSLDIRYGSNWRVLPLLYLCFLYLGRMERFSRTPSWLLIILNARLIRFASDMSYGVYLFHGFFISASGLIFASAGKILILSPRERVLLMFVFVSTFSYLTAWLTFHRIELPGIYFGKKVTDKLIPVKSLESRL